LKWLTSDFIPKKSEKSKLLKIFDEFVKQTLFRIKNELGKYLCFIFCQHEILGISKTNFKKNCGKSTLENLDFQKKNIEITMKF